MNTKRYIINTEQFPLMPNLPSLIGLLKLSTSNAAKLVQLHQKANAFLESIQPNPAKKDVHYVIIPCTSLPTSIFTLCEDNDNLSSILEENDIFNPSPQPVTDINQIKESKDPNLQEIPTISITADAIQFTIQANTPKFPIVEITTDSIPISFFKNIAKNHKA
jgi:hypothetical protein